MAFDQILLGGRTTRWSADLVDLRTGELVGPFTGKLSGSVDMAYDSRLKSSGKLEVVDLGTNLGLDWQHLLIQLTITMTRDGQEYSWRVGTLAPTYDQREHTPTGMRLSIELLSTLSFLSGDAVADVYVVPAGTSVRWALEQLVASVGNIGAVTVLADQDTVTESDFVWSVTTDKLEIANRLLEGTGYLVAQPDRGGGPGIEMRPLVPPHLRPVQDVLGPEDARVIPTRQSITEKIDRFSVPNQVISVATSGGDDEEELVGVAQNLDPTSRYRYREPNDPNPIGRDYWVTHTVDGVQVDSQAAIDSHALSTLTTLSSPSQTVTLETLPLPLFPYDVIQLRGVRGVEDGRYAIDRCSLDLDPKSLMKLSLRKVVEYTTSEVIGGG